MFPSNSNWKQSYWSRKRKVIARVKQHIDAITETSGHTSSLKAAPSVVSTDTTRSDYSILQDKYNFVSDHPTEVLEDCSKLILSSKNQDALRSTANCVDIVSMADKEIIVDDIRGVCKDVSISPNNDCEIEDNACFNDNTCGECNFDNQEMFDSDIDDIVVPEPKSDKEEISDELWFEDENCRKYNDENYSNDNDENYSDRNSELSDKLVKWAIKFNIPAVAVTFLLHILHVYHPHLPKDSRTLLKTKVTYDMKSIAGGNYFHFQLKEVLADIIKGLPQKLVNGVKKIFLQFNIDGLPLCKSSNLNFWPILGKISKPFNSRPFVIGLFCGKSKPSNVSEYLQNLIQDLLFLKDNGINITSGVNSGFYNVGIDCFICDAPARAFIKNIKLHNAYYGCEKCFQKGVFDGRVIFPDINAPLQTDSSFNEMTHREHHLGESPLNQLSVGLVKQIPLEPMHLVFLGVVRKLLWLWVKSPVKLNCKIGQTSIQLMSDNLVQYSRYLPKEFNRKGRSLSEFDRWKASEFRTFLLYTGIVASKHALPSQYYNNFLCLFVGIYCLAHPMLAGTHCDYAEELLRLFVVDFGKIYGQIMLTYNVHNLIHLANDAKNFGALHNFSAFAFESFWKNKTLAAFSKPSIATNHQTIV